MVTRREVLKGTAAVSIGAIAAAHGAAPAEAGSFLDLGFGQLTGGAIGGFSKHSDAFQIAFKFDKAAAELLYKQLPAGLGVAVFFKYFSKHWVTEAIEPIGFDKFPSLEGVAINFSKLDPVGAEVVLTNDSYYVSGKIEVGKGEDGDKVFFKYDVFEVADID